MTLFSQCLAFFKGVLYAAFSEAVYPAARKFLDGLDGRVLCNSKQFDVIGFSARFLGGLCDTFADLV